MKAGVANVLINPPLGTTMEGYRSRDMRGGCQAIHDNIYARALYLSHDGEEAVILTFDLSFVDRATADRFKGAVGRAVDLPLSHILMNTSHTHSGARMTRWACLEPSQHYIDLVEEAAVEAVRTARASQKEVTLWAGLGRTELPVSRRQVQPNGIAEWRPAEEAPSCRALPVCVFRDADDNIVSLLFSVSCHPSTICKQEISAEYPGAAVRLLNAQFKTEGSIFLQGTGGDAKPAVIAVGRESWRGGEWEDIDKAGAMVADAVIATIAAGLQPANPEIKVDLSELRWPLEAVPCREELKTVRDDAEAGELRRLWAGQMLARLEQRGALVTTADIGLHALQIAREVRLFGLEGEAVSEFGLMMLKIFDRGVTFPLGYTNGAQIYLTVNRMRQEQGYEVTSYYEYGYPAALQPVGDALVGDALNALKDSGCIANDGAAPKT